MSTNGKTLKFRAVKLKGFTVLRTMKTKQHKLVKAQKAKLYKLSVSNNNYPTTTMKCDIINYCTEPNKGYYIGNVHIFLL